VAQLDVEAAAGIRDDLAVAAGGGGQGDGAAVAEDDHGRVVAGRAGGVGVGEVERRDVAEGGPLRRAGRGEGAGGQGGVGDREGV
jgi:hypothetical protein